MEPAKIEFLVSSLGYQEILKKDKKEVAKEFEAILLNEFLKEAFKPFTKDKSLQNKLYYDAFLENISRKLAQAGGVGIAKFILDNWKDEKVK